ncbi:MAG: SDR family NAD(P)-dependent oxidoreductase [Candidatus Lindowbacteria bacterium]|nr:SDR family NAD(P)-dependent oxidoreductase [Candidatus Lindowbacteria bacterium]
MSDVDRVIYITGASRGLGLQLAKSFLADADREGQTIELGLGYEKTLPPEMPHVLHLPGDIADPAIAAKSIDLIVSQFGRLDLVIANAAVTRDMSLLKMKDDDWNRVMDVNLTGSFYTLRAAAKHLRRSRGSFLFVSSLLGVRGGAGSSNYAASKAAVLGLMKSAARELAPKVCINAIVPGYMPTDMGLSSESGLQAAKQENLFGELSSIEETANMIVKISKFNGVSGQIFSLNGRVHK